MSDAQKPRLVSIDGDPATVIQPHTFKKSGKKGWFSQQNTVLDGKPATIQVMIYPTEQPPQP